MFPLALLLVPAAHAGFDAERPFAGFVLVGGLAAHADLDPSTAVAASPMGGIEGSWGGRAFCLQLGADSAPLLLIDNGREAFGRMLAVNLGVTAGTVDWHVGPYGSIGFAAASVGVRGLFVATEDRRLAIEVRAGVSAAPGPEVAVLARVRTGKKAEGT